MTKEKSAMPKEEATGRPRVYKDPVCVEFLIERELLEAVDAARDRTVPRTAWLHQAIREKLARDKKCS